MNSYKTCFHNVFTSPNATVLNPCITISNTSRTRKEIAQKFASISNTPRTYNYSEIRLIPVIIVYFVKQYITLIAIKKI
jgi:starvation-inducible outer membrane lipoprotein